MTVLLGAVAYDQKVVTIWDGFRAWLRSSGLDFDYVLYSNYERQVLDLVDGRIDVAWNSPLAWVRARRLAGARGVTLTPLTMRDTDCDLHSVIAVRADSPVTSVADLAGRIVATGAVDSPQATLLPLSLMRSAGLAPGADFAVRRFDIGVGLHGDHIGGERDAARALFAADPADRVDAACMIDSNLLLFGREGVLPAGSVRVLAQTPAYDHCTMTAGPSVAAGGSSRVAGDAAGAWTTPTRTCARCLTWRGSRNGARPACPATSSWSARSTRPVSTTRTARSPRRATGRNRHARH
jgi:ABC-type phosphate/phosphonate transport system substrate-binding protein